MGSFFTGRTRMTCASSCIKACSLVLVLLAFQIFFNWIYMAVGYSDSFYDYYFEGLWGALPVFVTGIIGLSTACGDTPCKRITLLVTSFITAPVLCGTWVPLVTSLELSKERNYYYDYYYTICLSNRYGDNNHGYSYDCGGLEVYSVIQISLTVIAFITDIVLIIVALKHHQCCGPNCCSSCGSTPSVPMTVPGTVHMPPPPPGTMVYMVPQGYAPPPNYGVPVQAGHAHPQQVMAPAYFNQGMSVQGGQYQAQAPGKEPPSYQAQ